MKILILNLVILLCCGCINNGKTSSTKTEAKSNINTENWVKVNESYISFSIPKTMKKEHFVPMDSFAFSYSDEVMTLFVEKGVYAPSLDYYREDTDIIKYEEKNLELPNNQAVMANFQFAKGKGNYQDKGKEFGKVVKVNCENENDSFTILILFSNQKYSNIAQKIVESISVKCPLNQ